MTYAQGREKQIQTILVCLFQSYGLSLREVGIKTIRLFFILNLG
jgi:hypothetical protein